MSSERSLKIGFRKECCQSAFKFGSAAISMMFTVAQVAPIKSGAICATRHGRGGLVIADLLRQAISKIILADVLPPDARSFYESLPDLVSVWRSCERGRERGLHWTMDQATAEKFAGGRRCINSRPTLVRAQIPKRHIFAIFLDRDESEIVLDPRRLRKLSTAPR
jgi:hypothetical protein